MSKALFRLVTLLLIPSLVADSAPAASFSAVTPAQRPLTSVATGLLDKEALAPVSLGVPPTHVTQKPGNQEISLGQAIETSRQFDAVGRHETDIQEAVNTLVSRTIREAEAAVEAALSEMARQLIEETDAQMDSAINEVQRRVRNEPLADSHQTLSPTDPEYSGDITPPRVGSTSGHVDGAILEAYDKLHSHQWPVISAANHIVNAFRTMTEPERITRLQTAIDIIEKANQPGWAGIIPLLREYLDPHSDHAELIGKVSDIYALHSIAVAISGTGLLNLYGSFASGPRFSDITRSYWEPNGVHYGRQGAEMEDWGYRTLIRVNHSENDSAFVNGVLFPVDALAGATETPRNGLEAWGKLLITLNQPVASLEVRPENHVITVSEPTVISRILEKVPAIKYSVVRKFEKIRPSNQVHMVTHINIDPTKVATMRDFAARHPELADKLRTKPEILDQKAVTIQFWGRAGDRGGNFYLTIVLPESVGNVLAHMLKKDPRLVETLIEQFYPEYRQLPYRQIKEIATIYEMTPDKMAKVAADFPNDKGLRDFMYMALNRAGSDAYRHTFGHDMGKVYVNRLFEVSQVPIPGYGRSSKIPRGGGTFRTLLFLAVTGFTLLMPGWRTALGQGTLASRDPAAHYLKTHPNLSPEDKRLRTWILSVDAREHEDKLEETLRGLPPLPADIKRFLINVGDPESDAAFLRLGPRAKEAIPVLIKLTHQGAGPATNYGDVLEEILPPTSAEMPAILTLMENDQLSNRWIMDRVRSILRDAPFEKRDVPEMIKLLKMPHLMDEDMVVLIKGLERLGPDAKEATSTLISLMDDPRMAYRRGLIIEALVKIGMTNDEFLIVLVKNGEYGGSAYGSEQLEKAAAAFDTKQKKALLPKLIVFLGNSDNDSSRTLAVRIIGQMGTLAKSARWTLLQEIRRGQGNSALAAWEALKYVDPTFPLQPLADYTFSDFFLSLLALGSLAFFIKLSIVRKISLRAVIGVLITAVVGVQFFSWMNAAAIGGVVLLLSIPDLLRGIGFIIRSFKGPGSSPRTRFQPIDA